MTKKIDPITEEEQEYYTQINILYLITGFLVVVFGLFAFGAFHLLAYLESTFNIYELLTR